MDREPLTPEQLREIGLRHKGQPSEEDVLALLWEIKRLRDENEQLKQEGARDWGIISRLYQLTLMLPDQGGVTGMLIADFKQKMTDHPVRAYHENRLQRDLDVKPGDDDHADQS